MKSLQLLSRYGERERSTSHKSTSCTNTAACILLFLHHSLASIIIKKQTDKEIFFHHHFLPTASDPRAVTSCMHHRLHQSFSPKQQKTYFLGNSAAQTWHYTRHLDHFPAKACYTAELAFLISPSTACCAVCHIKECAAI